ncbi:hypothetical protein HDU67_008066 [Dinochytrium kinnereticum]|nr:hypothetical protein HDU67_008066 [Dinochytrium kinnereticum]
MMVTSRGRHASRASSGPSRRETPSAELYDGIDSSDDDGRRPPSLKDRDVVSSSKKRRIRHHHRSKDTPKPYQSFARDRNSGSEEEGYQERSSDSDSDEGMERNEGSAMTGAADEEERDQTTERPCPICLQPFEDRSYTFPVVPVEKGTERLVIQPTRMLPELSMLPSDPRAPPPTSEQILMDAKKRIRHESEEARRKRIWVDGKHTMKDFKALSSLDKRRLVYRYKLEPIGLTPTRQVTPQMFQKERALLDRVRPWITRDLQVLLKDSDVELIQELVVSVIERFDLTSTQAVDELRPYLTRSPKKFLQELSRFANSSLSMTQWDTLVKYQNPAEVAAEKEAAPTAAATTSTTPSTTTTLPATESGGQENEKEVAPDKLPLVFRGGEEGGRNNEQASPSKGSDEVDVKRSEIRKGKRKADVCDHPEERHNRARDRNGDEGDKDRKRRRHRKRGRSVSSSSVSYSSHESSPSDSEVSSRSVSQLSSASDDESKRRRRKEKARKRRRSSRDRHRRRKGSGSEDDESEAGIRKKKRRKESKSDRRHRDNRDGRSRREEERRKKRSRHERKKREASPSPLSSSFSASSSESSRSLSLEGNRRSRRDELRGGHDRDEEPRKDKASSYRRSRHQHDNDGKERRRRHRDQEDGEGRSRRHRLLDDDEAYDRRKRYRYEENGTHRRHAYEDSHQSERRKTSGRQDDLEHNDARRSWSVRGSPSLSSHRPSHPQNGPRETTPIQPEPVTKETPEEEAARLRKALVMPKPLHTRDGPDDRLLEGCNEDRSRRVVAAGDGVSGSLVDQAPSAENDAAKYKHLLLARRKKAGLSTAASAPADASIATDGSTTGASEPSAGSVEMDEAARLRQTLLSQKRSGTSMATNEAARLRSLLMAQKRS